MKATVHKDGNHYHQVGQDDDETHSQAQSNHHKVPGRPRHTDLLANPIVEEGDVVIIVAGV